MAVACARGGEQQSSPAVAAAQARPGTDTLSVEFRTREGCGLGIARYPDFAYDAQGGRGAGAGSGEGGTLLVDFDVASLYIPPMSGATTRFLGLPLPPFLKIDILPEALGGTIDRATGQVYTADTIVLCIHPPVVFCQAFECRQLSEVSAIPGAIIPLFSSGNEYVMNKIRSQLWLVSLAAYLGK